MILPITNNVKARDPVRSKNIEITGFLNFRYTFYFQYFHQKWHQGPRDPSYSIFGKKVDHLAKIFCP